MQIKIRWLIIFRWDGGEGLMHQKGGGGCQKKGLIKTTLGLMK